MNERQKLLRKISAAAFAAWELHIYLDTHPCDRTAMALHDKYTAEAAALKKEYTEKYGPLTAASGSAAQWLSDPWPWDYKGGEK